MFSEILFDGDVHGVVLLDDEVIFGRDLVLVPSDIERLIDRSTGAPKAAPIPRPVVAPPLRPPLRAVPPAPVAPVVTIEEPVAEPVDEPPVLTVVDTDDEDVAIDFSGVEAPRPEIMREAPVDEQPADDDTEDKPDMERIFASFPLGVTEPPPVDEQPQPSAMSFDIDDEPVRPKPPEPVTPPVQPAAPTSSPGRESPKDKLIRFVLGKTSSRDIFDVDGNLILGKGQEITEQVVLAAQAAELMPQVFLAASQGLHSRLKRS